MHVLGSFGIEKPPLGKAPWDCTPTSDTPHPYHLFIFLFNRIFMKRNQKSFEKLLTIILVVIIAINTFALLYTSFNLMQVQQLNYTFPRIRVPVEIPGRIKVETINLTSPQRAEIYVPAVSNEGKGIMTKIIVEIRPGNGRVLVNVDNLLFWVDTQHSIRVAKKVAERITGINTSNLDLIYTIETNASIVEGPSAGAAITIATIAALENKTLKRNITITGIINLDGTIGPVGGVFEKGEAAKENGFSTFLVPLGQGTYVKYIPEVTCEKYGMVEFCTTEYKPKKIDLSKELNISVVEVSNIEEALKYFIE